MIQGYGVHAAGAELLPYKYEPGELGAGEIEIRVTHCGVCHSDVSLIDNDWGMSQYPFVPGHEIVGAVAALGAGVVGFAEGDRVGVGWQASSCGHCEWCRRGEENLCAQAVPTCVHRNGGFAHAVRVNARFAAKLPDALQSETAAPLMCAGLTVYTPMRLLGVHPGSHVGVVGVGGLGHLALQFARIFGAEVTAFSHSAEKAEDAKSFGAHHFVNTRETKGLKALAGCFDVVLVTANVDADWNSYVAALRPHGRLEFVGTVPKPVSTQVFPLISGMRSVGGCNIGSPTMMAEMLRVAARHGVAARTELFPMAKANEAVGRVRKGAARYRAVLAN
jgi:alcohol/geraniol dehydrogenase (NADP+)